MSIASVFVVPGVIFLGFVVLAILGIRSTGKATQDTAPTGRKKSGPAVAAQRRGARPRRRRRPVSLDPDATVTLAEVRRETGVDEFLMLLTGIWWGWCR